jgi:hypothetical protein
MNLFEKCQNCGKIRGEHQAKTKACPVGTKSRIGWITYSPTSVFKGKADDKK